MATNSISKLRAERDRHAYTFHGPAVDDIRKALVLGLYLSCEVDRVRGENEARIGDRVPAGLLPRTPDDDVTEQIANALLWIEMTGGISTNTEKAG